MQYQNTPNNMNCIMPGKQCGMMPGMMPGMTTVSPVAENGCGCGAETDAFSHMPLAMAYVPWQTYGDVYPLDHGFHAGTIFPCLDMPFQCANPACGRRGGRL